MLLSLEQIAAVIAGEMRPMWERSANSGKAPQPGNEEDLA
jgi:hypothetical protein